MHQPSRIVRWMSPPEVLSNQKQVDEITASSLANRLKDTLNLAQTIIFSTQFTSMLAVRMTCKPEDAETIHYQANYDKIIDTIMNHH